MLEQELRALEALGQLLADRLLDDARPGEADEGARLGHVQVAEHGEGRGDAAGGGVGEQADEREAAPRRRRARAAEILAICMRESVPSIMRAPPEQETTISGSRSRSARSTARVTFSPTTTPIEPPMKPYSMTAITVVMPPMVPTAEMSASRESVLPVPSLSRAA